MKAAETSASSAIADWTPLTVVSKSSTTAEIDTFISDVSNTSTNIAIASNRPSRELAGVAAEALSVPSLVVKGSATNRSFLVAPLGHHGPVDVAVEVVGAHELQDAVGIEDGAHLRLEPRKAEGGARSLRELVDLRDLLRTLGVHEVDAFEVEDQRAVIAIDQFADAILEGLRRSEEEAPVEPDDGDPGEGLVIGVVIKLTEYLRSGFTSEDGHRGPGRHVDEPAQREHDADHDACEHSGREDT